LDILVDSNELNFPLFYKFSIAMDSDLTQIRHLHSIFEKISTFAI